MKRRGDTGTSSKTPCTLSRPAPVVSPSVTDTLHDQSTPQCVHKSHKPRKGCKYNESPIRLLFVSLLLILLLVLILLLLLGLVGSLLLEDSGGNSVEITHTVLADLPASVRVGLKDTDLLEGLNDVSLDTLGGIAVVTWAGSSAVLGSVQLGKGTDTNVLSKVDVTSDGS